MAIQSSIDRGQNTCVDAEAFFYSVSGAFQEVLAQYYLGLASPELAERVMLGFAYQVGYSAEQFDFVIAESRQLIEDRVKSAAPLAALL